jgi:hypothetical protein
MGLSYGRRGPSFARYRSSTTPASVSLPLGRQKALSNRPARSTSHDHAFGQRHFEHARAARRLELGGWVLFIWPGPQGFVQRTHHHQAQTCFANHTAQAGHPRCPSPPARGEGSARASRPSTRWARPAVRRCAARAAWLHWHDPVRAAGGAAAGPGWVAPDASHALPAALGCEWPMTTAAGQPDGEGGDSHRDAAIGTGLGPGGNGPQRAKRALLRDCLLKTGCRRSRSGADWLLKTRADIALLTGRRQLHIFNRTSASAVLTSVHGLTLALGQRPLPLAANEDCRCPGDGRVGVRSVP